MKWIVKASGKEQVSRLAQWGKASENRFGEVVINDTKCLAKWNERFQCLTVKNEQGLETNSRFSSIKRQKTEDGAVLVHARVVNPQIATGQNLCLEFRPDTPAAGARAQKKKAMGSLVRSQINGKVLDVLVQPGQNVEQGECLLVIEAMKMENKIFAPIGGRVKTVSVEKGASVASGEEMVRLEPV